MAEWIKHYDQNKLASELEKIKKVDKNGNVSFRSFEYLDYSLVLESMLTLNQIIPDYKKKNIIKDAISIAAKEGNISSDSLLANIKKLESGYLRRPFKKYKLVTSISINKMPTDQYFRMNDCTISFKKKLSAQFYKEVSKVKEKATSSIIGEYPTNYIFVTVLTQARSCEEASQNSLNALDLLRGIWNFYENRKHGIRISTGKRSPVNSFILGPLHTLHLPNGKLATEKWWYDPGYVRPHETYYEFENEFEKLSKFTAIIRRLLKRSNYTEDLTSIIIRYTQALDLINLEYAFLQLWSVLERLTGIGYKDNYNILIRRSSFVFGGEIYSKQVLTHLRDYRNRAVHEGSDSDDIEGCLYQLKRYVEALIEFHLGSKYRFKNIAEAATILDMSCDKNEIEKKRRALNYAKKFLGYK
jgi:hypothetical protein